jgi:hypothetical protein
MATAIAWLRHWARDQLQAARVLHSHGCESGAGCGMHRDMTHSSRSAWA